MSNTHTNTNRTGAIVASHYGETEEAMSHRPEIAEMLAGLPTALIVDLAYFPDCDRVPDDLMTAALRQYNSIAAPDAPHGHIGAPLAALKLAAFRVMESTNR